MKIYCWSASSWLHPLKSWSLRQTRGGSELNAEGRRTKSWVTAAGRPRQGRPFDKGYLYRLLNNRVYLGEAVHKGVSHRGEHDAIVPGDLWNKVHAILSENWRTRANHARAATPAPLKGLIR